MVGNNLVVTFYTKATAEAEAFYRNGAGWGENQAGAGLGFNTVAAPSSKQMALHHFPGWIFFFFWGGGLPALQSRPFCSVQTRVYGV